jgi:hypothetical protein
VATVKPLIAAAVSVTVLLTGVAHAQTQRSGGGASPQLMQQYQQVSSERAQLQADNEKMKKQLDDMKKQLATTQQQLDALKAGASRGQAALAAAHTTNENTEKSLDDTKAKMQELIGKFRETLVTLRNVETERTQLQQQLTQSRAAYDRCAVANDGLYQINNEVLNRYSHQGTFSCLSRDEPFTRLTRTRIENLSLEYRQRADQLRIEKSPAGAAASPAGAATPGASAGPAAAPARAPAAAPVPAAATGGAATTSAAPDAQATPASKP